MLWVSVAVTIFVIVLIFAIIGGIVHSAPLAQPYKQWALWAVGGIAAVLVIAQLLRLLGANFPGIAV